MSYTRNELEAMELGTLLAKIKVLDKVKKLMNSAEIIKEINESMEAGLDESDLKDIAILAILAAQKKAGVAPVVETKIDMPVLVPKPEPSVRPPSPKRPKSPTAEERRKQLEAQLKELESRVGPRSPPPKRVSPGGTTPGEVNKTIREKIVSDYGILSEEAKKSNQIKELLEDMSNNTDLILSKYVKNSNDPRSINDANHPSSKHTKDKIGLISNILDYNIGRITLEKNKRGGKISDEKYNKIMNSKPDIKRQTLIAIGVKMRDKKKITAIASCDAPNYECKDGEVCDIGDSAENGGVCVKDYSKPILPNGVQTLVLNGKTIIGSADAINALRSANGIKIEPTIAQLPDSDIRPTIAQLPDSDIRPTIAQLPDSDMQNCGKTANCPDNLYCNLDDDKCHPIEDGLDPSNIWSTQKDEKTNVYYKKDYNTYAKKYKRIDDDKAIKNPSDLMGRKAESYAKLSPAMYNKLLEAYRKKNSSKPVAPAIARSKTEPVRPQELERAVQQLAEGGGIGDEKIKNLQNQIIQCFGIKA